MALAVPLSRFTSRVGGGSAFVVRHRDTMRTLKVELAVPNALSVQGLVPEFQNFGEDVYRDLRDECDVSLDEIDHFAGAFHLRGLHKRDVRTIAAKLNKILERYHSLACVKIYEVPDEHEIGRASCRERVCPKV